MKTFIRWAAEKAYGNLAAFEGLRLDSTRGKKVTRNRGKPKLRDHERLRWWAHAMELARKGDEGALGVMMCLDGNLRSGEFFFTGTCGTSSKVAGGWWSRMAGRLGLRSGPR